MSKRITLSVPDKLHKQIERWRSSFNLSRTFQDAVAEVIRQKENLEQRIQEDLPQVVARLRREKKAAEKNWFEEGLARGQEWARSAHWLDLKKVLPQKAENLAGPGGDLQDYFQRLLKREEKGIALKDGLEDFRRSFLAGCQKGVRDFWALVRDKL